MKYHTLTVLFIVVITYAHAVTYEQQLINHVKKSIELAKQEISSLSPAALSVEGLTSVKVRHFLNNVCKLPNSTYLEIGVWKGATFVAALYGNHTHIKQAIAIDNWSQIGGPRNQFAQNCKLIDSVNFQFHEHDCFTIDKTKLCDSPINIYFYDGNHREIDQERAFTYFNELFAPVFIAIVDDWNHPPAKMGTKIAFETLGYTVLYENALPAKFNGDTAQWWNGLYVAVIKKP